MRRFLDDFQTACVWFLGTVFGLLTPTDTSFYVTFWYHPNRFPCLVAFFALPLDSSKPHCEESVKSDYQQERHPQPTWKKSWLQKLWGLQLLCFKRLRVTAKKRISSFFAPDWSILGVQRQKLIFQSLHDLRSSSNKNQWSHKMVEERWEMVNSKNLWIRLNFENSPTIQKRSRKTMTRSI